MNESVNQLANKESDANGTEAGSGLRERQRLLRENAILDAAHALIGERGYDAMTMDELAQRTGISKPTLYQHFPSKEMIVVRAVVSMMQRCHVFLEKLDVTQPAIERLHEFVRWIVHEKYVSGKPTFGAARAALMPVLQANAEYTAGSQRTVALVKAIIEEAQADGTISSQLSSRVVVQMVISLMRDTEYEKLILSGECTPREIGETMIAVLFDGIESAARRSERTRCFAPRSNNVRMKLNTRGHILPRAVSAAVVLLGASNAAFAQAPNTPTSPTGPAAPSTPSAPESSADTSGTRSNQSKSVRRGGGKRVWAVTSPPDTAPKRRQFAAGKPGPVAAL